MYSVVLMMAMTSGGNVADFGHRHGCCGGKSTAGCCGGSTTAVAAAVSRLQRLLWRRELWLRRRRPPPSPLRPAPSGGCCGGESYGCCGGIRYIRLLRREPVVADCGCGVRFIPAARAAS